MIGKAMKFAVAVIFMIAFPGLFFVLVAMYLAFSKH